MPFSSPILLADYPITRMRIVSAECDALAADLRAISVSVRWESEAARAFFVRVGEAVGQVAVVGRLAADVATAVQWQVDNAPDEGEHG